MATNYVIDDSVMIEENDGTWSVTCNGSNDAYHDTLEVAIKTVLENEISEEDCEAWHNGEGYTSHLQSIIDGIPVVDLVFQVWGSPDGQEPLSVIVESFKIL